MNGEIDEIDKEKAISEDRLTLTFDDMLDRIGFGRYQWMFVLIMGLIDMMDGAEVIMLAVIQANLQKEWDLGPFGYTLLILSFFVGFGLGALFCGYAVRSFGRKKTLITVAFVCFICAVGSSQAQNLFQFIFFRWLFGVCIGLISPTTSSIISEITPLKYRSMILSMKGIPWALGQIYGITIGILILDSLGSGDWRLYLIVLAIPTLIVAVLVLVLLEVSPRYALLMGDID